MHKKEFGVVFSLFCTIFLCCKFSLGVGIAFCTGIFTLFCFPGFEVITTVSLLGVLCDASVLPILGCWTPPSFLH